MGQFMAIDDDDDDDDKSRFWSSDKRYLVEHYDGWKRVPSDTEAEPETHSFEQALRLALPEEQKNRVKALRAKIPADMQDMVRLIIMQKDNEQIVVGLNIAANEAFKVFQKLEAPAEPKFPNRGRHPASAQTDSLFDDQFDRVINSDYEPPSQRGEPVNYEEASNYYHNQNRRETYAYLVEYHSESGYIPSDFIYIGTYSLVEAAKLISPPSPGLQNKDELSEYEKLKRLTQAIPAGLQGAYYVDIGSTANGNIMVAFRMDPNLVVDRLNEGPFKCLEYTEQRRGRETIHPAMHHPSKGDSLDYQDLQKVCAALPPSSAIAKGAA